MEDSPIYPETNKLEGNGALKVAEAARSYTYEDYAGWDDGKRYELIDGVAYLMSPAPTSDHQDISRGIFGQLYTFLRGKPCKVYSAPFDVRLSFDGDDKTVVQPDISVVCDRSKIVKAGCNGAPDLVIEILSPSSGNRDRLLKFNKYLQAGVREYWIVDPESRVVEVHTLESGRYVISVYGEDDTVDVSVLEGCRIVLPDVFAEVL